MGRKRERSRILAVVSDIHANSTVAVCPPGPIPLDDGGSYNPSRGQRWLWQNWRDYWGGVERLRDTEDAELWVEFNGDAVEGDHHGTSQLISRNPDTQAQVVEEILAVPLALKPDRIFVVRGTESHVGKSGASEERLAKRLPNVVGDPETGTASWWHLRIDVGPLRLDFAHHGRTGYRPWTEQNATNLLAEQIFSEHARRFERHPDVAFRSHFHRFFDSGRFTKCPTRVIQTPAWQLKTAYVHRVAPESISDIGGIITIERGGEYDLRPVLFKPERGPVWTAG